MNKTVLILNELAPRLQEVTEFFGRIGANMLFSGDGKNSYEQIVENKPSLAVLGVAMQGYSGVEVLRRVKEDEALKGTKIVLIADFENESIKNRAMDAGCDYYVTIDKVPHNLYDFVEKLFKEPPRVNLRVQADFGIALAISDKKVKARCVNLSRSGVLVLSEETLEIGTTLSVGMKGAQGEKIIIKGMVARLVEVPAEQGPKTGLGIKFTEADPDTVQVLEKLIKHLRGEVTLDFSGTKIDLEPLIDLLLSEDAFFAQYIGTLMHTDTQEEQVNSGNSEKESSYKGFNFFFPKLQNWEIAAFAGGNEETEVYLSVIRKMVMLFVKFENCYRVIDNIPFCDPSQEQTLINVIEGCFDTGATTEKEVEQILSSEISMRTVGLSSQIAKTRNKYLASKVKLLKGFVEHYQQMIEKKSHLEAQIKGFAQILVDMKQDVEDKKQEISKELSMKKEKTKESTTPEHKGPRQKGGKAVVFVAIAAVILFLFGTVYLYKNFIGNRVSVSEFAEPGIIASGKVEEGVLILESEKGWNPERDKEITRATLDRMYPKMRDKGYEKIKLIGPDGRKIASVLAGPLKTYYIQVY